MTTDRFPAALRQTLKHEGVYSDDKMDPGGKTYLGISRVYWPDWEGWLLVDEGIAVGGHWNPELSDMVSRFYRTNFWNRIMGDELALASVAVANEVFDTAVNLGVQDAARILQTALNMQREAMTAHEALVIDGKIGPKTLGFLRLYLSMQPGSRVRNEEILLNCLNGEQYIVYKANPRHTYFRGWFLRV